LTDVPRENFTLLDGLQGTENPRVGGSIPPLGTFNGGTSGRKLSDANRFNIPTVFRRTELRAISSRFGVL
jgi:hypothetical protein